MPGNIRTAAELVDKIQDGKEMTKEEMLSSLADDQKISQAFGLQGDYAQASPVDAKEHERASEIAENAYDRVQAGEFDDRFKNPEIQTKSRNDDMEMEMEM
ncbi:hypothetical protein GL267_008650 [Acidithiobacillus ferrianus]|uniref:Uncharacterized protein n=2 Tax=Acidithiobacillus ferrianus TaxID=2678518 RepID=A0A845UC24_9PROT|nr:hypothetical protein [Acidithiobacillus ferrianus]NDU43491.1 hypothetical protein [Acidithiobacillus ferrianus]